MSAGAIAVTAAGVAAIAWVNWYFFLSQPRGAPSPRPAANVSGDESHSLHSG